MLAAKLVHQYNAPDKLIQAMNDNRPDRKMNNRWLIVGTANDEREENSYRFVPFRYACTIFTGISDL